MAITFDFDGSLALAAQLVTIADDVEAAATARQGPRDTALARASFQGPYGNAHRGFADDEDAQLDIADDCRTAADAWAAAWATAANDHNEEVYNDALVTMRRLNDQRIRDWRFRSFNNPLGLPEPFPQLGAVVPPRAATTPAGSAYSPTDSIAHYAPSGIDLVPEYRNSL